jgi:hypothetical protein
MPIPTGMVCRASITIKGVTYYAKDYGKKAFCWFPKGDKHNEILAITQGIKKITPGRK